MLRTTTTLVVTAVLAACATVNLDLPPITEAPTDEHQSGRVVWHDLLTTTPAASRRFYGELFGWTFERTGIDLGFGGDDSYMLIRHNGRLIGGMIDANDFGAKENISQWVTLISASDVDAMALRVAEHGGTVITQPMLLASRGTIAVFRDSSGALFAMIEPKDGNPTSVEPGVNSFLWDEVWTDDVESASQFYASVIGYRYEDRSVGESEVTYRVLHDRDAPRVGVLANPFTGERPVWVNYIRVIDPAAITAQVEALGGRIIVPAQPRDIGGQVAFVAGPSGAGIALQTWPLQSEEAE